MTAVFEQYLFEHDAEKLGKAVTHTNMMGGKTNDSRFHNSGTYHIDKPDELRDLLLALPGNYRHGLSEYLPEHFAFFVDLDLGLSKPPRPKLTDVRDWACEIAAKLQSIIEQQVVGNPKLSVVVSVIAARKIPKGFKSGVHLHVPQLTVTKEITRSLASCLSSQIQFPTKFNIGCTEKQKLVDVNLFASKTAALRMYNATKLNDDLSRYKVVALLNANGTLVTEPKLQPSEEFVLTQLKPEEALCQLFSSSEKRALSDSDSELQPEAKRILTSPQDELQNLFQEKIAKYFPEAKVSRITRTNGTVWLAHLTGNFCWIKRAEHDSPSAFLTITKNGIQPGCLSSVCKTKVALPRVQCFSGEEVVRYFTNNNLTQSPNNELAAGEDPIARATVDDYNQRFAFVMLGESNCNLAVVERRAIDPLTGSPGVRFMSPKVFSEWYRDDRTPDGRLRTEIWLKSPRQARYKNVVFLPGINTEVNGWFNMWQGFPWDNWDEWIAAGGKPIEFYRNDPDLKEILDFIYTVICSSKDDTWEYIMNWLAFAVQHPDQPSEVSLALRGKRGIGKTFFGQVVSKVFGIYGKVIEAKQLSADFNGSLKNCILLVADEASGQHDPELMVRLQHIATAEYLDINLKNIERFRVKNCLHIILCSNFNRMVAAGRDGRRYCVFDVSPIHKKDQIYFGRLNSLLTPTFYSKFLTMLSQRNIQGWIRTDWPLAAQLPLWENKQVTLSATEHWLYEKLRNESEEHWNSRLYHHKDKIVKEVKEYEVSRQQLPYSVIVEQELNSILAPHQVCTSESGRGVARTTVAGKHLPAFRFPKFSECREAFSQHVETNPVILWPNE